MKKKTNISTEWQKAPDFIEYNEALAVMEARLEAIQQGTAPELVWLLEHMPLYTAGTSAKIEDLLNPQFPVYQTGRGGQYTYHGPQQRMVYVLLNLKEREMDVRLYVECLEEWVIRALAKLEVQAMRREGRVGLWVPRCDGSGLDDKIAAIGVRIKKWVTMHGLCINVNPNLSHYAGIVPCGIKQHGVTSLAALGKKADMDTLDNALKATWDEVF